MVTLGLVGTEDGYMVKIVPPQTNDGDIPVGKGAYCFVIDVSGSMNAAAQVTTNDGDKVDHGWSQLDIAKHSTNTFISSLEDGDFFSVVTYSDGATVLLDWTVCNDAGRERAIAAVHSMRPERSTNLMAGITTGFAQFESFASEHTGELANYALNLVITTDGMPSSQWHPARGRDGYGRLVKDLSKALVRKRGAAANPVLTSIGIGLQLDSELLLSFSETFLHMPDPGQIGPFIVNLLANARCTARLEGRAANSCKLVIKPASALRTDQPAIPGYDSKVEESIDENGDECVKLDLGAVLYDQPRHVLLKTAGGERVPLSVALELAEQPLSTIDSSSASIDGGDGAVNKAVAIQQLRVKAVVAIEAALAAQGGCAARQAPLSAFLAELAASPVANAPVVKALANTIESECKLGCDDVNFPKWGAHYFRTLPCMLKAERRSNFRDECLQHFGKDARMREALFETQSHDAEMRFAQLKPPEPSLLRPQPLPVAPPIGGGSQPAMAAPPPPRMTAMPEEFMRGGGCFGPDALVTLALPDGSYRRTRVGAVVAGDMLLGEAGRHARVECVVMTECVGRRAMLTCLPNGLSITEWHPVRDAAGRWRFPIMLGKSVVVNTPYVYNFVLSEGHATVVVNGVPCAALGHGLEAPVVAHPYWGTRAVLDDLATRPGYEHGRVVLAAAPNPVA